MALASCFALLVVVLALNAIVDPYGTFGTGLLPAAVETDRSIKLDLIDDLSRNPEIVILGSSRARQAEPAFLERLTGHAGFNAGVTGGTAADALVMARYVADRFPDPTRRYVWFVDSGIATNGVNPQLRQDRRAQRYLPAKGFDLPLGDLRTYLGAEATRTSWRVIRSCVLGTCARRIGYLADGSIAAQTMKNLPERTRSLSASVAELVASVRARPPGEGQVDPRRYSYFEQALAFMNAHGARPVIVLNPIHPEVLAELRAWGFPARKQSLAYLEALHRRLDFVVVDCEDIERWGGSAQDFNNATHVNRTNMRRMLVHIVAHSDGALG